MVIGIENYSIFNFKFIIPSSPAKLSFFFLMKTKKKKMSFWQQTTF